MAGGRPKADDPKTQVAIYPPTSVWDGLKAIAAKRGEKPAILAVEVIRDFVERVTAATE